MFLKIIGIFAEFERENITRIDTFEWYKEDLKIYAVALVSQPGAAAVEDWQEKAQEVFKGVANFH